MYLDRNDNPLVKAIIDKTFPECKKRRVEINYNVKSLSLRSYWDSGYRTYYKIVRLSDLKCMSTPTTHPVFDPDVPGIDNFEIPAGFVVVEHKYCGGNEYLEIDTPESAGLIESQKVELSEDEIGVLLITASVKSSYAGISDFRAHELRSRHGYTMVRISDARKSLQEKGLLDKRNAITNAGRNAIENHPRRFNF